jgi:hypothetical protein
MTVFNQKGFTTERWCNVWKSAIDATAILFPKHYISLCLDVSPNFLSFADIFAKYAVNKWPLICLQSNGLSSKFLRPVTRPIEYLIDLIPKYKNKATIGFQMTWASAWKERGRDRLGPLDQAIDAGIKLGASYLEIYQDDIIDPKNATILANAARRLKKEAI